MGQGAGNLGQGSGGLGARSGDLSKWLQGRAPPKSEKEQGPRGLRGLGAFFVSPRSGGGSWGDKRFLSAVGRRGGFKGERDAKVPLLREGGRVARVSRVAPPLPGGEEGSAEGEDRRGKERSRGVARSNSSRNQRSVQLRDEHAVVPRLAGRRGRTIGRERPSIPSLLGDRTPWTDGA